MHAYSTVTTSSSLGCTKNATPCDLKEYHMIRPYPPSIQETSQAETAILSMIFRTGLLNDSLLAGRKAVRSVSDSVPD